MINTHFPWVAKRVNKKLEEAISKLNIDPFRDIVYSDYEVIVRLKIPDKEILDLPKELLVKDDYYTFRYTSSFNRTSLGPVTPSIENKDD